MGTLCPIHATLYQMYLYEKLKLIKKQMEVDAEFRKCHKINTWKFGACRSLQRSWSNEIVLFKRIINDDIYYYYCLCLCMHGV